MTIATPDYVFTAIENTREGPLGAEITFGVADEASDRYLTKVWANLLTAVTNHHDLTNRQTTCPTWAKWRPHQWTKQVVPARLKYIAWHGLTMAGFLNLQHQFASPFGGDVTYVEHMATFPGNITTSLWMRRLEGVGIPLIAFSVLQSLSKGYNGRVGLHVDGPAIKFYERAKGSGLFDKRKSKIMEQEAEEGRRPIRKSARLTYWNSPFSCPSGQVNERIQATAFDTSGTLADVIAAAGSGAAAFPQSRLGGIVWFSQ